MKIVIFCEDRYNEPIRILTRKILGEKTGVIMRTKKRHDLLQSEKVCSHIINDILQEYSDVLKIIVCLDSECTDEKITLKDLKTLESLIKKKVKEPVVHCLPVTHALEGWLLADSGAVKEYLGSHAKVNIPLSATSECKPEEVLGEIFRKAGREFIPVRDNERIADGIDIGEAAKNNKSFARFCERIKDL